MIKLKSLLPAVLIGALAGTPPQAIEPINDTIPQQGWRLPEVPDMKSKHQNKKRKNKRKAKRNK